MQRYSYVFDLNEKYLRCGLFVWSSANRVCHKKIVIPRNAKGPIIAREMYQLMNEINLDFNVKQAETAVIGFCLPDETEANYSRLAKLFECDNISFEEMFMSFFEKKVPTVMLKKTHVAPFSPRRMYPNKNHSVYAIQLGEKIKSGFTNNNEVGVGFRSMAGDIGEMSLTDDDNNVITLNSVASNSEMINYATQLIKTEKSILGDGRKITMDEIYKGAHINDPVALKVVNRTIKYVAKIAAQIAFVMDPQCFIINSGQKANYQLHEMFSESYKKYAHKNFKNISFFVLNGAINEHFFGMAQYLKNYGVKDGREKLFIRKNR